MVIAKEDGVNKAVMAVAVTRFLRKATAAGLGTLRSAAGHMLTLNKFRLGH